MIANILANNDNRLYGITIVIFLMTMVLLIAICPKSMENFIKKKKID